MNLFKSVGYALALLGSLASSTALAIPNIRACSYYVSYASGWISNADIQFENNPHPVSSSTATTSATGRCYNLWLSRGGTPLSYANAGGTVRVWPSGNGYNYQCLRCGAIALPADPRLIDARMDVRQVAELVREALPEGQILSVNRKLSFIDAAKPDTLKVNFEVDVAVEDHITRVSVDGESGELTLPEVTRKEVVYPENVCR